MITRESTRRIAELAKLRVTEEALDKLTPELRKMARFADNISAVAASIDDARYPEPTPNDSPARSEARDRLTLPQEELLSASDSAVNGFFRIGERSGL